MVGSLTLTELRLCNDYVVEVDKGCVKVVVLAFSVGYPMQNVGNERTEVVRKGYVMVVGLTVRLCKGCV